MACPVCGKDVGFWAKLGSHPQVCKACTEQGQNRLKVLATSVGWVTNWQKEQADRWLTQFDEIVHKYQVPTMDTLQARNEILDGIFKLVEWQEQIADADVEYLVGLGQRYGIALTDETNGETVNRVAKVQVYWLGRGTHHRKAEWQDQPIRMVAGPHNQISRKLYSTHMMG